MLNVIEFHAHKSNNEDIILRSIINYYCMSYDNFLIYLMIKEILLSNWCFKIELSWDQLQHIISAGSAVICFLVFFLNIIKILVWLVLFILQDESIILVINLILINWRIMSHVFKVWSCSVLVFLSNTKSSFILLLFLLIKFFLIFSFSDFIFSIFPPLRNIPNGYFLKEECAATIDESNTEDR